MPARSPEIINTWRHRVNETVSDASDLIMRQRLMSTIMDALVGGGSWVDAAGAASSITDPWEIDYQCDSVTAGTPGDAVDRLTDTTDFVWNTTAAAHSWAVFVQRNFFGVSDPLYMLIDLTYSNSSQRNGAIGIYLSQAGFTGGSTTARPTATDEHEVRAEGGTTGASGWQGSDATNHDAVAVHFSMADDGTKFRVMVCDGGECVARWDLFHVDDADTNWDRPVLMAVTSHDVEATEVNTWANAWNAQGDGGLYHGYDSVQGAFTAQAGMPGYGSLETLHTAHASSTFGSRVMPVPIPLRGNGSPVTGPLTVIPDCWWMHDSPETGEHAEDDQGNLRRFAIFGDMLQPWPGVVMQTS